MYENFPEHFKGARERLRSQNGRPHGRVGEGTRERKREREREKTSCNSHEINTSKKRTEAKYGHTLNAPYFVAYNSTCTDLVRQGEHGAAFTSMNLLPPLSPFPDRQTDIMRLQQGYLHLE